MGETRVSSDAERLTESLGELPEPQARPALVVVSGLPGTGKSYFCRRLAERMPLAILESDALRKTLFPQPTYSPAENGRLFRAIHHLSEDLLKKGVPLVLDATNLAERHREYLYRIAERQQARLILVRVEAPPEVVYERLRDRATEGYPGNHSDADWAVFQKLKPTTEHIRRRHFRVDTTGDISSALERIVRAAKR